MSHNLEIPDPIFDALQQAASAAGTTPLGWIAAQLPDSPKPTNGARSLAEALTGRIGRFHSGGKESLSQDTGERFTDYLEQKRREGRL